MPTQTKPMPQQYRAAAIQPASFDAATRSVEVVFSTGASVRRYDWWEDVSYDESLLIDERAMDLSRLSSGAAPVLNAHRMGDLGSQIGVVERAWIDNGEGRALLRLSQREELAGLVADIQAGIIRNISIGYSVRKYEVTPANLRSDGGTVALYRAVDWQPFEISFVPVPADAGSGTRNQAQGGEPCEFIRAHAQTTPEHEMTKRIDPNTPADDQGSDNQPETVSAATRAAETAALQRAADITDLASRHGFGNDAADWIRSGKTIENVKDAILERKAAADKPAQRNVRVETVSDETETRAAGIQQAILHRIAPNAKLDDNGRQYRGMSLIEIGRDWLEAQGVSTRGLDRHTLAGKILHTRANASHGVTDFANLLANVANNRLRQAYDENIGSYQTWARRAPNAPDFKAIQVTNLAAAPDLVRVNEHGEFTYGTASDGREIYSVISYGRIVSLTRQAIINDDLRGFDRLVSAFGNSARRLENRMVYAQLTANANLADGVALFHASRTNLGTGAPSALQASSLTTARTAMRLQKGLQSEELNLAPSYLIVPAALEQAAYQLTSNQYTPATVGTINEFRAGGRTAIEPIVEPLLDANSATAWYLAADNAQVDTVEYCYLDGAEGAVIESDVGFEMDGVSYKCRLDFGTKAIDFRGLYRSNGV